MALDLSVYKTLHFYPRGEHFTGTINNSCNMPWTALSVDLEGKCYLCKCEAHLPVPVGRIYEFTGLEEVWNNAAAHEIQQTIVNKKFTYCAVDHCGIKHNDVLYNDGYYISINIDESCNLACPTCRRQAINHTAGEVFERKRAWVSHFVDMINNFDKPLYLTMCGNGDPLASLIMRPLVLDWKPKANHTIQLFTNGLLISKLLPDSPILPNIQDFKISVDAGSAEVYEVVRKPGKFSVLQDNLKWLADTRGLNTNVTLMFTLSALNANDVVNFANMCNTYNFRGEITKLDNWMTFDNFESMAVLGDPKHPLYDTAVSQLREVSTMSHITISPFIKNII